MNLKVHQDRSCERCAVGFAAAHSSQIYCDPCRSQCNAPGCDRAVKSRGYCLMHYKRWKSTGDINFGRAERVAAGYPNRKNREEKVSLVCEQCKNLFLCPVSMLSQKGGASVRRFCSKVCYTEAQKIAVPTFVCGQCGVTTARSKYEGKHGGHYNYKQRFCGRGCADESQRTGSVDKNGYRVFSHNGRQYQEHRVVIERYLGRPLASHETVHHKNGDRTFNDLSNLELWSSRHGKGQRVEDKIAFARSILTEYGVSHEVLNQSSAVLSALSLGM